MTSYAKTYSPACALCGEQFRYETTTQLLCCTDGCANDSKQHDPCHRCGIPFAIGDYPFCKGNPEDHRGNKPYVATLDYVDPHISPSGPVHITSHAQRRRLMRENGLEEMVVKRGMPGQSV